MAKNINGEDGKGLWPLRQALTLGGKGRLLVKRTNELILGGWQRISLRVWNDVPTEGREGMKASVCGTA